MNVADRIDPAASWDVVGPGLAAGHEIEKALNGHESNMVAMLGEAGQIGTWGAAINRRLIG